MSVGVVATTRTEHRAAIDRARHEAALRHRPLVLLTPIPALPGSRETWYRADSERRRDASAFAEAELAAFQAEGLEASGVVVDGDTEPLIDALLRESRCHGIELLVLASPPRSRVGELVLGSLVRDLVLEAPVPVLVVRAQFTREGAGV